MKKPIKLVDGTEVAWKSAEENGVTTTLYDDDFSYVIDGSGYMI